MRAEIGHMPALLDESATYRGKVVYFSSNYRREVSAARVILGMCLFGGRAYGGGVVGKKLSAKIDLRSYKSIAKTTFWTPWVWTGPEGRVWLPGSAPASPTGHVPCENL